MIPGKENWTVILSKESGVWGSYTYDEKEDALRVKVQPVESPMREALEYSFQDIRPDGATLVLAWEKLAVPVAIGVDTNAITKAKVERQLRDLPKWTWESWNDAAQWALGTKVYNEDALKWAEESIRLEERFDNMDTKAQVLTAMGKPAEAQGIMAKALPKASTLQRHGYARRLLNEKKVDEALAVFRDNAKKNPDTWYVYGGLARGLSAKGDYKGAASQMAEALKRAPKEAKPQLEAMLARLQKGEDINS
jgi:predicted Zn-dependent protease